jgi:hypothetical protein
MLFLLLPAHANAFAVRESFCALACANRILNRVDSANIFGEVGEKGSSIQNMRRQCSL